MTSADLIADIVVALGIVFMGILAVVPLVIDYRPRPRRVPAGAVVPAQRTTTATTSATMPSRPRPRGHLRPAA